ncbi:MAG: patB2, partial [Clostridiaceae bacterium]|nr:patB2 [Clostridiaceae bacterium]
FGKEGIGFERINLACPTKILEKALERLLEAVKKCYK